MVINTNNSKLNNNKQLKLIQNTDNLVKNINKLFILNNRNKLDISFVKTISDKQKKIILYIDELNNIINAQKDIIKLKDYENQQLISDNNIVRSNIDIMMNRYGLNYKKRV